MEREETPTERWAFERLQTMLTATENHVNMVREFICISMQDLFATWVAGMERHAGQKRETVFKDGLQTSSFLSTGSARYIAKRTLKKQTLKTDLWSMPFLLTGLARMTERLSLEMASKDGWFGS